MDITLVIKHLLGEWIVQQTLYSSSTNYMHSSIKRVNWSIAENQQHTIHKSKHNLITNSKNLYLVQKKQNSFFNPVYFLFSSGKNFNQGNIIRMNHNFKILSNASFQLYSDNFLSINYKKNNLEIQESITFINSNLKFVQSIVKKNQQCIGISFTSEIKIK